MELLRQTEDWALEAKIRQYRPEVACTAGKGIWKGNWRKRHGRSLCKSDNFKHGARVREHGLRETDDRQNARDLELKQEHKHVDINHLMDRIVSRLPSNEFMAVSPNIFWNGGDDMTGYYEWLRDEYYDGDMPEIVRRANAFRPFVGAYEIWREENAQSRIDPRSRISPRSQSGGTRPSIPGPPPITDYARKMREMGEEDCAKEGKPVPVYDSMELIGKGSFGRVYKAASKNDGKLVAVKIKQGTNAYQPTYFAFVKGFEEWRTNAARSNQPSEPMITTPPRWLATPPSFPARAAAFVANSSRAAERSGVKLFVLDDGWFGNEYPRVNDDAGLGDCCPRRLLRGDLQFRVRATLRCRPALRHQGVWYRIDSSVSAPQPDDAQVEVLVSFISDEGEYVAWLQPLLQQELRAVHFGRAWHSGSFGKSACHATTVLPFIGGIVRIRGATKTQTNDEYYTTWNEFTNACRNLYQQSAPWQYSNKLFEIRKSVLAGYGAFARKDLKWGQKTLVEPELFHADSVTLYGEFDMLSDGSQKAFKRMAAHCPTAGFDEVTSIVHTNGHGA
ncbi:kinase-like protein [Apiospora marii]|uniref:Kinase-like protein n=1 Tax=Apiospora marii TaxID=335849 RepID=A0ABR1R4R6_9PEZI